MIRTLWRGKWKIAFWMFLSAVLAIFWLTNIAVPKFTATTVIALENRNEQVTDLDSVLSGLSAHPNTVFTEAEVLKARNLAKKVVQKLNLTADPEFNKHIREKKDNLLRQAIIGAMDLKPEKHHFDLNDEPDIVRFMNTTGG